MHFPSFSQFFLYFSRIFFPFFIHYFCSFLTHFPPSFPHISSHFLIHFSCLFLVHVFSLKHLHPSFSYIFLPFSNAFFLLFPTFSIPFLTYFSPSLAHAFLPFSQTFFQPSRLGLLNTPTAFLQRGKTRPMSILDMTLNHLMVMLQ